MLLKRTNSGEQTERRFRDALHAAMGLLGRLLPDTEAMVRATNLNDEITQEELPEALRDPRAVFDRDRLAVHTRENQPVLPDAVQQTPIEFITGGTAADV